MDNNKPLIKLYRTNYFLKNNFTNSIVVKCLKDKDVKKKYLNLDISRVDMFLKSKKTLESSVSSNFKNISHKSNTINKSIMNQVNEISREFKINTDRSCKETLCKNTIYKSSKVIDFII